MRFCLLFLLHLIAGAPCFATAMLGYNNQIIESSFDIEKLSELATSRTDIKSTEELLIAIAQNYPEYAKSVTYMQKSRSLQSATPQQPRGIVFGETAFFILAFTRSPNIGHENIEAMQYNEKLGRFDFFSISYSEKKFQLTKNPKVCESCHGVNPIPIWDSYDIWPQAYGQFNDIVSDPSAVTSNDPRVMSKLYQEIDAYEKFLASSKSDPVYKMFPRGTGNGYGKNRQIGIIDANPERPNRQFSRFINYWMVRSHYDSLKLDPKDIRNLHLGASLVCTQPFGDQVSNREIVDSLLGSGSYDFSLIQGIEFDSDYLESKYRKIFGNSIPPSSAFLSTTPRERVGTFIDATANTTTAYSNILIAAGLRPFIGSPAYNSRPSKSIQAVSGVRHFFQSIDLGRMYLDGFSQSEALNDQWQFVLEAADKVDKQYLFQYINPVDPTVVQPLISLLNKNIRQWCLSYLELFNVSLFDLTENVTTQDEYSNVQGPILKCAECHSENQANTIAPIIPFDNIRDMRRYLNRSDAEIDKIVKRIELDPNSRGIMPPSSFSPLQDYEIESIKSYLDTVSNIKVKGIGAKM